MNHVRVTVVGLLGFVGVNAVSPTVGAIVAAYEDDREAREPLHTPANGYATILASGSTGTSPDTTLSDDLRVIYAQTVEILADDVIKYIPLSPVARVLPG